MIAFDVDKTITYWHRGAKYDLSVASALIKAKKYPYALFMGHLALEKILKALVVKRTRLHAPFSHSLPYLGEKTGVKLPRTIRLKLREFMEFHFEARYPDASKAFYDKCAKAYTVRRFREIKEVSKWIEAKL